MASQQPATFSPAFQARLRKAATEGGMTPAKAVTLFENYIGNPRNAVRTSCNNEAYIFKFPVEIKHALNCIECLRVLKTNLKSCGFRENHATRTHHAMQPGEFTFIKNAPHQCNFNCQQEGECYTQPLVCDCDDRECHTLMLCL